MSSLPRPQSAWDQYWRDGRVASCGGEDGTNYQPVIADGWRRFFGTLADGERVLDVCTGNGAVARLAAEAAHSRGIRVTIEAVDSALIHPAEPGPGMDMVRFSSRVAAEELSFPDDSFDAIVAQYAIEYTELDRTLAELQRVSAPAARVRFVMHAAGSVVVREAARQLGDVDRLLGTGIFEAADALAAATDAPDPALARDARRRFDRALQALNRGAALATDRGMYHNVGSVIVHAIHQLPRVGSAPVLDKIGEAASAIRSHQARLEAMQRAALDAPAAQALCASAARRWNRRFELAPLERSDDGALFGWVLESAHEPGSTAGSQSA